MAYDPKLHSKNKMGLVGHVPVVPMMPVGAQVNGQGMLHVRLLGESYVSTHLRGTIPPGRVLSVKAAIKASPLEPSYSGSGAEYVHLEVEAVPGGGMAWLKAGPDGVKVCGVLVDPDWEIVSTDESIEDQVGTEDDDPDEDE